MSRSAIESLGLPTNTTARESLSARERPFWWSGPETLAEACNAILASPDAKAAEQSGPTPFFVLAGGRDGSRALAYVLGRHPAVYCGAEEDFLWTMVALLSAQHIQGPIDAEGDLPFGFRNEFAGLQPTPIALRHLMDGWAKARSGGASIVGDKTLRCFQYPACLGVWDLVFPDARVLTCDRCILDTVTSCAQKVWLPLGDWADSDLYEWMTLQARERLSWRDESAARGWFSMPFEAQRDPRLWAELYACAFEHIGVAVPDMEQLYAECEEEMRHRVGGWRDSEAVEHWLSWLGSEDNGLRDVLMADACERGCG